MSSVPSSIAFQQTTRADAVWWKACTKSKNMTFHFSWSLQSWNYNTKTILHEMRNCDNNSSVFSKWAILSSNNQTASLSSGSLARCNPVTLLSSPTLSNLISRRHFSPLGLAKVGGWSWCNSALHLIIGAFRDNGEGRWNQFPASSTNMGQPSSPSTPSSLSYLSIRQVWNEDGRCRNTAD